MSHRKQRRGRQLIFSYVLTFAVAVQNTAGAEVIGGIATDGTMGPALTLGGANIDIPQSLGSTSGNNLFHSFTEFNIANGQTVQFTGSSALQNVISRVTGTDVTEIEGALKSGIANAAFYFINPNGITFGEGAEVDVPGGFHVSTADKLDFPGGDIFYADSNRASSLSSEAPAAFGFLGTSSANNGLIDINGARLHVNQGQAMDIVAGGIKIGNNAQVLTNTGEIRLVAVQDAGTISLQQTNDGVLPLPLAQPSATHAGRIEVNDSVIGVSGNGAGRIALWGGEVTIKDSQMQSYNNGPEDASAHQGLDIRSQALSVDSSLVAVDALKAGKSGNINIETETFNISNDGVVRSSSFAGGDAGHVTVTAGTLRIDNQGRSTAAGILSRAESPGTGQAGNITIQAGTLAVLNGGIISSSTFADGNAGNVTVTAEKLTIDNQADSPVATGIFSRADKGSSGHGGHLNVNAGTLAIVNGGAISSFTASEGDAGRVIVSARELNMRNGGKFSSSTFAGGNAGHVGVTADQLTIDGVDRSSGAATGILSQAAKNSSGQAGNVSVQAGTLTLLNGGLVSSDTFADGGAGKVEVSGGTVGVYSGSYISSGSWGAASSGRTGNVSVNANGWLHLNSGYISIENEASVPAADAAAIEPGIINVTAPDIDMKASEITTNSAGNVAAGAIGMNFSHWLTTASSFIATTANTGDGGAIVINGGELIHLQNSGFRTTVSGANSNGGDIFTTARMLVTDSGLVQANAVGGSGGNITLSLSTLLPSGNTLLLGGKTIPWQPFVPSFNVIQAASETGVSGTVNVTAPQLNLSGVLANLGGPQFDTTIISQDYCELGAGSSLTRKGAGGVMPKSGEQLLF